MFLTARCKECTLKTNFSPDEFLATLDSVGQILKVLARSNNFQELVNSDAYGGVDFRLPDAIQAIEQAYDAYGILHQSDLAEG